MAVNYLHELQKKLSKLEIVVSTALCFISSITQFKNVTKLGSDDVVQIDPGLDDHNTSVPSL